MAAPQTRSPDAPFAQRYGPWALVTGASSGIGRAIAHGLAARGQNVVLVSDQRPELDITAAELRRAHGVETRVCCVDLARDDFLADVERATDGLAISVLVNNASFGTVGPFETRPFADYDTLIRVNVRAYAALTHAYLPAMRQAGRGALVFVASINALAPIGGSAVYTASKAFELYLGGALWYELRDTALDVLIVLPGPTRTGFQKKAGTKLATWAMEPEEVADGALNALGSRMLHVPGERNQALAAQAAQLSLEQRIVAASQFLHAALVEGVEPAL